MENKVCKKYQKPLRKGYKHKKRESCRNAQIQGLKNGLKAAAGVAESVAGFAVVIVTKGKVNLRKQRLFGKESYYEVLNNLRGEI